GRGVPRPRSAVRAQVPRLLPDRRRGGRSWTRDRRVLRRAPDRRTRFRAQEVRAPRRHDVHLRADDPAPALAAAGLVRQGGMTALSSTMAERPAVLALRSRHQVRAWEALPWVVLLAFYFAFPKHLGFGTEVLVTILFAVSLDLVLGYAGIVTL